MTDAMNPLGRTWSRKRLMNSSALSVIVRYRACPLRRVRRVKVRRVKVSGEKALSQFKLRQYR
jgi:hypothetical protein